MQLLQKQKQNDVPNTKLYSTTLRLTSDNINAKMKIRNRVLKALSGTTWGMDTSIMLLQSGFNISAIHNGGYYR